MITLTALRPPAGPPQDRSRATRNTRRARLITVAILAVLLLIGGIATALLIGRLGASAPSSGGGIAVITDQDGGFDVSDPTIGGLDVDLLTAVQQAAADAAEEGVSVQITSGRRSAAEQEQLLQDAVAEYGSLEEAERWVATPETSAHVAGEAVDIGDFAAALWIDDHGARYGLCRIYDNEPWHFELRPEAASDGCPDLYWDPTYDPRMQR